MKTLSLIVACALLLPHSASAQGKKRARVADDATIVTMLDAAYGNEIEAARLALTHTENAQVRELGAAVVKSSTAAQQQLHSVASIVGSNSTSANSATGKGRKNGKRGANQLGKLKGAEFDLAFLQHEVSAQRMVLDAMRNRYLPAVKNAELKSLVEKSIPVAEEHLQRATTLLGKSG